MSLWLQRSHGDHSYWDVAAANFKHAIGLSCELVVEHVNSFIHSGETPLCVCFSTTAVKRTINREVCKGLSPTVTLTISSSFPLGHEDSWMEDQVKEAKRRVQMGEHIRERSGLN